MKKIFFKIADEFSATPGPRYKREGSYSAELLLETKLNDLFKKVIESNEILVVDLDGTKGYATSFLEGTFGELARKYTPKVVLKHLEIISVKKPFYKTECEEYIKDVEKE